MERNKIESISKIPQLERVQIAERIVAHPDWTQLGLCFESRYKWKRTKQELASRLHANATQLEMCERLIEDLAEQGFSTAELIAALQYIGLSAHGIYIKETYKITFKEIESARQFLFSYSHANEESEQTDRHVNLLILTSPAYRSLIEHKLRLLNFFLHESKMLWILNGEIKWYALVLEYGANRAAVIRGYAQYASEVLCIGDCATKSFRGVEMIADIQTEPPFKMSFSNKTRNKRVRCMAEDIDEHLINALTFVETSCFPDGSETQSSALGCVVRSRSPIKDYIVSRCRTALNKIEWIGKYIVDYFSVDEHKIQHYVETWIGTAHSFVQKRLYIAFKFDITTVSVEDAKQMVSQQVPSATRTVGANSSVVVFVETPLYYAWELSLTADQLFESFKHEGVILRQISHLTTEEVDKAIARKDNEPYLMELKDFKKRMEQYGQRTYDHPLKFISADNIIVMKDSNNGYAQLDTSPQSMNINPPPSLRIIRAKDLGSKLKDEALYAKLITVGEEFLHPVLAERTKYWFVVPIPQLQIRIFAIRDGDFHTTDVTHEYYLQDKNHLDLHYYKHHTMFSITLTAKARSLLFVWCNEEHFYTDLFFVKEVTHNIPMNDILPPIYNYFGIAPPLVANNNNVNEAPFWRTDQPMQDVAEMMTDTEIAALMDPRSITSNTNINNGYQYGSEDNNNTNRVENSAKDDQVPSN